MALNLGELFGTIGLDASEWDRKLEGAQGSLKAFGVAGVAIAATAAVAIGAALSKGIVDSINIEAGTDKLQASLGLTEAQAGIAGDAAGSVYAQNFGGSMEEVNVGVEAVMSSIGGMRDGTQADVEDMTKRMLTFADSMEIDVARASQVAGQMINTGMAKNGIEAADLLTAALQRVPKAVREDVMDAVDEYGPFLSQMGISGDKAMGLLVKSSKKGMYGIDKTGDALKEFTLLTTTADKGAVGAFEAIGLNAEDMARAMAEGGPKAAEALQATVDGLQDVEDPATKAQMAISLFGVPLEDLGTNGIPGFLSSLDSTEAGLTDVAGTSDKAMSDLASNAKAGFDGFKRQAEAALITFVQDNIMPSVSGFASFLNTDVGPAIKNIGDWITNDALPALKNFGDWLTENKTTIQTWATVIGVIMLPVFIRVAVAAAVSAAAQVVAWTLASGGAIKAAAVYVAQSYIMIARFLALSAAAVVHGIVVAAVWTGQVIASAVSAVIAFAIQAGLMIGHWVAMSVASSLNAIKMAAAWVVGVLVPAAGAVIAQGIAVAGIIGGWVAMAIQSTVQALIMAGSWLIGVGVPAVAAGIAMVIAAAGVVAGWVSMAAGALINAAIMAAAWLVAFWPVALIIAIVIGLVALIILNWEAISKFTAEAWANVTKFLSEAWDNITRTVSDGVTNVLNFFRDLPGKIGEFFAGAGTWLLDAGKWILDGFLKGLTDGFNGVKDFVGGIGDWIAKNKGPKAYDKALLIPAGGWIMGGLEQGLEDSIPSLQKTLGGVSATIAGGVTGGTVGLTGAASNAATASPAAATASGGTTVHNWYITEADKADEVAQKVWTKFQFKAQEAGLRVGV